MSGSIKGLIAAAAGAALFTAGITAPTPVRAEYPEKPVEMTVLFGQSARWRRRCGICLCAGHAP